MRGLKTYLAMLCCLGGCTGVPWAADTTHWDYEGHRGPEHWGELTPAYATCRLGTQQSPVNIVKAHKTHLPPLQVDYQNSPLHIVNNGHTIQVNFAPGSHITVADQTYQLVQMHFHVPSEEQIEGKTYDMVAHLVHRNREGKLAVVAVLFQQGREHAGLAQLHTHLPPQKGSEETSQHIMINASRMLPETLGYYTYEGSLTTPPCSEGVTWYVLRQPVELSAAQYAQFSSLYRHNARPIQPAHGRLIRASID
jgi:carbonic anhydrase